MVKSYWSKVSPESNDLCPHTKRRGYADGRGLCDYDVRYSSNAATDKKCQRCGAPPKSPRTKDPSLETEGV